MAGALIGRSIVAPLALVLAGGCGGTPAGAALAEPDAIEAPDEVRPRSQVPVVVAALPGSRVTMALPRSVARAPHGLRFTDEARGLSITVSDATVEPGAERELAETLLMRLPEARVRPVSVGGADGIEVSMSGAEGPLRSLTLWRDGAVARVLVRHRPEDAALAERILDSVRLGGAPLDPRAALRVRAGGEGLTLLPVSTEQLTFRESPRAVPFPSEEAGVDVVFAPFGARGPPASDAARGQLLGERFAGLPLEGTQITPLEDSRLPGFEIVSTAMIEGTRVALYGAYLEEASGAWLVRASVDAARAPEWGPRFRALVRSLETP